MILYLRIWIVIDGPRGRERHQHGDDAFENKDPRPPRQPTEPPHLRDTPCQYPAKGTRQLGACEEESHAEAALVPEVPLGDVVVDTGVQPCLKQAQESAGGQEAGVVLDEALTDHAGGPCNHDKGEPSRGLESLHHHVAWDLGRHVERVKDDQAVVVLELVQTEISFQVLQSGVANVGSVEEAEALVW